MPRLQSSRASNGLPQSFADLRTTERPTGTEFDDVRLSRPLLFDSFHRSNLFTGLRLHRHQPDFHVSSNGTRSVIVTVWSAGGRWCDRGYLGKSVADNSIKQDCVAVMPPQADYSFRLVSDGGMDFTFYIDPGELAEVLGDEVSAEQVLNIRPTPEAINPVLVQAARDYASEFDKQDRFSNLAFESIALKVCTEVARSFSAAGMRSASGPIAWPDPPMIRRAKTFILDYLDQPIGLKDIASAVGMSQYHFSRTFKQSEGITPYQFVREQRLIRAMQLLKSSNMEIAEVAFACGFSSQQHLTSAFTGRFGVPPAQWRRLRRN